MPELLAKLLIDAKLPHDSPNENNADALNLLITSALTEGGSLTIFIHSIFTTSLELVKPNNPNIPYPPYSRPLSYNSDWEASSRCISRSTSSLDSISSSEEPLNSPATQPDPISNLLTPTSDLPPDSSLLHPIHSSDPSALS